MGGFTFKQFHINQENCAMKVGTDGILLGAWTTINQAKHILDMGTGTGLIALMLAQRSTSNCRIQAIELDPAAARQAKQNVQNSKWKEKIQVIQQDIYQFSLRCRTKFDLIVANPPYFQQGIPCSHEERNQARYMRQCHSKWLEWAASCLNEEGIISFILPIEAAKTLQKSTALYCVKQTEVITKLGKAPQRMLLSFSQKPSEIQQDQLIIYDEKNCYHADFIHLTKAFYLKF
ncbi:tRNA1(Val) (adenine(37)-N6)-methyltransferase [Rodentibacter caecimuris]|uniref:tRNA1(Val) (adenine(37)-N6)-methyltransferase n=1 Tax=Rodentibacter caecimuris TaxID=1796644 RepID=A0ABX3L0Y8_9PAST|nr:tRNA (adenosine(37)-N6)-methyltransferase TrmM [Rodentibacter heylii]